MRNFCNGNFVQFLFEWIYNGNRRVVRVINKIGRPRCGGPICLITSMITDQIGRHKLLLPINHNHYNFPENKCIAVSMVWVLLLRIPCSCRITWRSRLGLGLGLVRGLAREKLCIFFYPSRSFHSFLALSCILSPCFASASFGNLIFPHTHHVPVEYIGGFYCYNCEIACQCSERNSLLFSGLFLKHWLKYAHTLVSEQTTTQPVFSTVQVTSNHSPTTPQIQGNSLALHPEQCASYGSCVWNYFI